MELINNHVLFYKSQHITTIHLGFIIHGVQCMMAERSTQNSLELHTPAKIVNQSTCWIPKDLRR